MNQEIDKLIKQIARLRTEVEILKEARKEAQTEYEQTPEFKKYEHLSNALGSKDVELAALELDVKQKAVKIYCDVTNTEVGIHPAIGIRQVRKLEYDSGDALVFCRTNLMADDKAGHEAFRETRQSGGRNRTAAIRNLFARGPGDTGDRSEQLPGGLRWLSRCKRW